MVPIHRGLCPSSASCVGNRGWYTCNRKARFGEIASRGWYQDLLCSGGLRGQFMSSETEAQAGDVKPEGAPYRQSVLARLWVFGANATPNSLHTLFYRHRLLVRATHWLNAVILLFMLMSGLQIFNAH